MSQPYLCPQCQTNRTRFAIIEQSPAYVKLDPQSGEIIQQYDNPEQLQIQYNGSGRRVHCGACGLIEDEQSFIATAKRLKFGEGTSPLQVAVTPSEQFTQNQFDQP
ncbi:DNA alkylation repair protein [Viridibacillus arvi]|uniref:DNA alkylation repair protein n=1 Tax=Viridibacillus arvi TaxID=263475 RepID=UPI00351C33E9